ncbi:MAG: hypothetical protein VW644_14315, partial [Alphaproteobacteria bacterium]
MFASLVVCGDILASILDPAYRPARFKRGGTDHNLLRHQPVLGAEAATDIGRIHPELAFAQAKAFGDANPHHMWALCGEVERQLVTPVVPQCKRRSAFQRHRALPVQAVFVRDRDLGRCARGLDIATGNLAFDEDVIAPGIMQQRVFQLDGFAHVYDCRQWLDLELNRLRQIFGRRPGRREADCNRLADIADLVLREDWKVGCLEAGDARHGANGFQV